jgi:hypothetical protein
VSAYVLDIFALMVRKLLMPVSGMRGACASSTICVPLPFLAALAFAD